MSNPPHFYDQSALLERLSKGLKKRSRETIFLVGAPISAPTSDKSPGVPGAEGVISLIRREFEDDAIQLAALEDVLASAQTKRYQQAFVFLQGRRGPKTISEIVREAVLSARCPGSLSVPDRPEEMSDDDCRNLELDAAGWAINPGTEYLAKLAVGYPDLFGKSILTTNFDPLIEVAVLHAGGVYFRTTLHTDGNLSQAEGSGCHIIHLHGYWYGSDTLHTARQLGQPRPRLRASLNQLLRNKLVVVCAYGGWDDVFTQTMMDVVRDDNSYPEVIWTFHSARPSIDENFLETLGPGMDRGRISLYAGIDCHLFFPELYRTWLILSPPLGSARMIRSNSVKVADAVYEKLHARVGQQVVVEGGDEDRPPVVEICVGRERDLDALRSADARVVFLTGLGGQGKSTLAAEYFADCQRERRFSFYVWRDCKEERERFENQIANVVEKLSSGRISRNDLAKQSAEAIVEVLLTYIGDVDVMFVFDNVDHYVNLDTRTLIGGPHLLVDALSRMKCRSQAVFTCRPSMAYNNPGILSNHLKGLALDAALQLFQQRKAQSTPDEISDAHQLADGHAFWLDLLAVQVAKPNSRSLPALLAEIRSGGGLLPETTLSSIWGTLREREQLVLRAMAETVKPETEVEISEYVRDEIKYNQVAKALRALRALNLVVVKHRSDETNVLELHPLVRQFIRQRFTLTERVSFIDAIIRVYKHFMGTHKPQLGERASFALLEKWTQNAELDVEAGRFEDAFITLQEVAQASMISAYPREFSRTARLLLAKLDWVPEHSNFSGFEMVFKSHLRSLSNCGEYDEVDDLLEKYETTVPVRDARYINYCDMRCYSQWARGDFSAAVEWGRVGHELKASSDIDTKYSVEHSLALAERDAGHPESALLLFLGGRPLAEVVDPEELDERRGAIHYGNVGRCLHFIGQIDAALTCYQKSALLLEINPTYEDMFNQGFVRYWIGELLAARQELTLARVFLRAACLKWKHVSPPRASVAESLLERVTQQQTRAPQIDDGSVESICLDWIMGRSSDS
jgi:tetratricopeptide (TPR) repeat protein